MLCVKYTLHVKQLKQLSHHNKSTPDCYRAILNHGQHHGDRNRHEFAATELWWAGQASCVCRSIMCYNLQQSLKLL